MEEQNMTAETTATENTGVESKSYTAEEIAALIQSEADKRVSQALKTQQKKHEKELSLSKLDDNAREKAERESRIQELEEQLAQFQIEKNRSELKSVLASRGLDGRFADLIVVSDSLEESQANIDALDKLFKAAVKAEVEKRLAGSSPKTSGFNASEITKEQASKMSLSQLQALKNTDPEAFKRLYPTT
jgi:hypothetical protein